MFLDDLPIWGMVGEMGSQRSDPPLIFTHSKLEIGYNGDRVIEVNLTSENPRPIQEKSALDFSYEIIWKPVTTKFENRFQVRCFYVICSNF